MKIELVKLTKDVVLKYVRQEQIFERYLGFYPRLREQYRNPLRKDDDPDCSFYYREGTNKLIFHDFAWGMQWDCFDVVQFLYNVNFPKALEKVAHDFGLFDSKIEFVKQLPPPPLPKSKMGITLEIKRKPYTYNELMFWNIGGLVIDEKMLKARKIYSISHLWEHTPTGETRLYSGLYMTFAYHWEEQIFQIYSPRKKREKGERRFINPFRVKYGDLEFLDLNANHVVITKSKKDAFYLSLFGINVFFVINESIMLDEHTIKLIKGFPIAFTLFDNDRSGLHRAWMFRKEYGTIPLYYEEQDGKDTTDVINMKGKQYMIDMIDLISKIFDVEL